MKLYQNKHEQIVEMLSYTVMMYDIYMSYSVHTLILYSFLYYKSEMAKHFMEEIQVRILAEVKLKVHYAGRI
jgi:hypothetical protein